MTDVELRDEAIRLLKETTVGYKSFRGRPPGANTAWGKALALLAQIRDLEARVWRDSALIQLRETTVGYKYYITKDVLPPASSRWYKGLLMLARINTVDVKIKHGHNDAALRAAIEEAEADGKQLFFQAGLYTYDAALTMVGIQAFGVGPTSILQANNQDSSAIVLQGANPGLWDLKITSPNSQERSAAYIHANVQVDGATDFLLERLTIVEAEQNSIIVHGETKGGVIRDCICSASLADGIHITDFTEDILVENNTVTNSGDDLIATVSYLVDPAPCQNITIRNNVVSTQANGRGIANVGGTNVIISDNMISNSDGAGVIVCSDGSYGTYGPENTTVVDNIIDVTDVGEISHAGIEIFGQPSYIARNTLVRSNHIKNTGHRGIRIGSNSEDTTIEKNAILDTAEQGIYVNGGTNFIINENILTRAATYGVYVTAAATGTLSITDNLFRDINTSDIAAVDVIRVEPSSGITSGEISGNRYYRVTNNTDNMVDAADAQITKADNLEFA